MTTTIVQNRKKYSHKHTHSLTHKCVLIILYAKYKNLTRHKIAHANIILQWPRKARNCTKMKQNQTKQNFAYFISYFNIIIIIHIQHSFFFHFYFWINCIQAIWVANWSNKRWNEMGAMKKNLISKYMYSYEMLVDHKNNN